MSEDTPPKPPDLLPNYLVDGIGNQDLETLSAMREYIDELIEWMDQPVEDNELPDKADPVEDDDGGQRGTVVMEKVTCGDETCKCMKKGEKHGPYKYVYYRTADGTLTSDYIDNE
jgi:hypothetical protein